MQNAAGYQQAVAPNSYAAIFGTNLASTTATAALDANGQLPTQLGNVQVEIDGQAAALNYVSPSQINFIVPEGTTAGTSTVVVRPLNGGATKTGTAQVQSSAPGLFALDASGAGAGAILNAVTYTPAPFLVETTDNGGSDKRTRLAIYSTGLRYAGNPSHDPSVTNVAASVRAQGRDSSGKQYQFAVEFAGAAPGYFGLDQVNLVVPPELDGAGAVSLVISTDTASSNTVTFQMGSLPASSIHLASLTLSKSSVNGGESLTGTVSLNAPARALGVSVSLTAPNIAVQLPGSVSIPSGQASAQFSISTSNVNVTQMVTITAQSGGATQSATLEVDPGNALQLTGISVTPSSVQGGHSASGTVQLSGTASSGSVVQIASDNGAAQPPASVTVPAGNSSATFSIPTTAVTDPQSATITATLGSTSKTAPLTVAPVLQLKLDHTSVVGGNSVSGTITLGDAAPATGVNLTVQCDNRTIAQPPSTVTIPGGQNSVSFTIPTITVTVVRVVTITVTYAGSTQSVSLTVNPAGAGTLSTLTVAANSLNGGLNTTGTVTLTAAAPAGGTSVGLQSSAPLVLMVPTTVTVPQGQTSATFSITTRTVSTSQPVNITATAGGVSKTTTVTVH